MSKTAPAIPDSKQYTPLAPVLGQIGTMMVCAGALIAHLSDPQLRPLAVALWIAGLLTQVAAFALASGAYRPGRRRDGA